MLFLPFFSYFFYYFCVNVYMNLIWNLKFIPFPLAFYMILIIFFLFFIFILLCVLLYRSYIVLGLEVIAFGFYTHSHTVLWCNFVVYRGECSCCCWCCYCIQQFKDVQHCCGRLVEKCNTLLLSATCLVAFSALFSFFLSYFFWFDNVLWFFVFHSIL